ncbi:hypothetical protein [Pinibacter aurantiacus]|uniref:Uncharacterized protein n=1 Tax=Pinibacter aurantiacus TaxID=2851599 RepID=A0A9E2SC50_9BACT|nr:hypothetical protein [Pinibacter aurantiacus]MBV4360368.1 hypothetical protein [Pinibacter aurantiacus]
MAQITINDIKVIVDRIESGNYDCSNALDFMHGKIENQKINDDYNKVIIRSESGNVKVIIIDCIKNIIKAISFNGSIDISPNELLEMFTNYREEYSSHDDLYFYLFNDDKKKGRYTLSFFEPSHKQVNVHQNDEWLSNLTLSWE